MCGLFHSWVPGELGVGQCPSLKLCPVGGEIGMCGVWSLGGGEIGMCGLFRGWGENKGRFETCPYGCLVGGGEIGSVDGCGSSSVVWGGNKGRFETCPYGCLVGGGEIGSVVGCGSAPSLCLSPVGGEIGVGFVREVLELFELALDVREGRLVVVGWGRRVFRVLVVAAVVVAVVVAGGCATTGGAVFFGHLGSEERGHKGCRGVGLPSAFEEQHFHVVGVFEDGIVQSLVEAEGVVGLPLSGGGEGDVSGAGGVGGRSGLGELV